MPAQPTTKTVNISNKTTSPQGDGAMVYITPDWCVMYVIPPTGAANFFLAFGSATPTDQSAKLFGGSAYGPIPLPPQTQVWVQTDTATSTRIDFIFGPLPEGQRFLISATRAFEKLLGVMNRLFPDVVPQPGGTQPELKKPKNPLKRFFAGPAGQCKEEKKPPGLSASVRELIAGKVNQ